MRAGYGATPLAHTSAVCFPDVHCWIRAVETDSAVVFTLRVCKHHQRELWCVRRCLHTTEQCDSSEDDIVGNHRR